MLGFLIWFVILLAHKGLCRQYQAYFETATYENACQSNDIFDLTFVSSASDVSTTFVPSGLGSFKTVTFTDSDN